jgi:acyl-CoA synthetase (AMP-forming)/AMP-acid ligase II
MSDSSRVSDTLMSRRIRHVVALDPSATALSFYGATFPWSFYSDAIADLESLLPARPSPRRVGIVLRNRPGPLVALIAALGTGREVVTLSPHLGDVGLARDIIDLAPDVIVAEDEDWARDAVLAAAETVGAIALRTGPDRAIAAHPVGWRPDPTLRHPGDVAVLMMTSGTTGRPKRVELSYDQMTAAFAAAGLALDEADQPCLQPTPDILWASLAHISGLYFAIAQVLAGRSVALLEKFEVGAWMELVRRHRPGYVRLAPTALRMVYQADVPVETFASVRAVGSGTAPLPPELAEAFEDRYGIPVLGTYGATEFAGAIAGWTLKLKTQWGSRKRGSVGRAHRGIGLRIVDPETGDVLPSGEIGLLEARGSQLPGEGWLRTTDLASLDDDGFLFIHGRSDSAINRGGFKIPPSVIEEALLAHPSVDEASAVAVPDPRLGEVPVAAVTLVSPVTEAELAEYLASRLTRYQRPVAIKVVAEMPRTPSLKISHALVRERYFSEFDAGSTGESDDR